MEKAHSKLLQNFDDSDANILKKRLLKSTNSSFTANIPQNNPQPNVLMNSLRTPMTSSMLVSTVQAPQSSMSLTHNLVTHSIAPMKIHTNTGPYPLQLSTVHVPVQIPGSNSNINVPVQLSGPTSSVPLQLTAPSVSLPLQVAGTTTNVPVQLPAGDTINVPLHLPTPNQNIQITGPTLPSMPLLQNASQPLHSSIIHLHMGNNARPNMDNTDLSLSNSLQFSETTMKMACNSISSSQVQVSNAGMVQMPSVTNNSSIQLQLPSSGTASSVQLRSAGRTVPHLVYIQTPSGLKPVTSSEVMNQASSSGNPPQIIVRKPVVTSTGIQLIPSKSNIAPKISVSKSNKSSILAANSSQPIVIQKPKPHEKMVVPVPVSMGSGNSAKPTIAYLGSMKKSGISKMSDSQSILIPNNQLSSVNSTSNQKLFLTPMNMPKMQSTKFILPVTLPATMSTKGPIINLQIANGQIQNDPQGNITVMRDPSMETNDMPPLQPLVKANGKDGIMSQSLNPEKTFTLSIPGSRAEPTGEQEYTLSIPETNASMNDDIYTVSIADDEGGQTREKSFTLSIPEKGKSLLNKMMLDRNDNTGIVPIPAPAILRRSNSDTTDSKTINLNLKRRISLCNENLSARSLKPSKQVQKCQDNIRITNDSENNDDLRVPSLFCDEQLDRDLDSKVQLEESDTDHYKSNAVQTFSLNYPIMESNLKNDFSESKKHISLSSIKDLLVEEDPPGLVWHNGIAHLQGSILQFQTNEFGLIDVIDGSDQEENFLLNPSAKYNTPLKQRVDRSGREKKPSSPEDLYCCDGCGCHGMAADFVTPNFCSLACRLEVQKQNQIKRDKERAEQNKKKNKAKKLLIREQRSASEVAADDKDKGTKGDVPALKESRLADVTLTKLSDEDEYEKCPWFCEVNGFSWIRYLEFCKAKQAPASLFKDPFPYERNGFRVGMRLEAIDPSHPSLFCVVSVAELQGYRIRLHFDGYSDVYDFWVNADSVDIFPPGWCEKSRRKLQPPANYDWASTTAGFSWPMYLKQIRAVAAPKQLFPHTTSTILKPNGFRIGMKLEAEDRKNQLVCVATVADMLNSRILVNFDSWDEIYDYWVEPSSPYIHPVGWAEENGTPLTPPNYYKDPDTFTWERYLKETGAAAAPARAFKTRPPHGFRVGMKLEVVDPRVPFLIRVATVRACKQHQVQVSFDGWPKEFDAWLDDDSPDIHPVGYCLKTGHALEPPSMAEEASAESQCGVAGCHGLGSVIGGSHKTHSTPDDCPYRNEPAPPQDRLEPRAEAHASHALPRTKRVLGRTNKPVDGSTPTSDAPRERPARGRPPKHKRVEEVTRTDQVSDEESVASSGRKRWRGERAAKADACEQTERASNASGARALEADIMRTHSLRAGRRALGPAPRLQHHLEALRLPKEPMSWTQSEVSALLSAVGGEVAGRAALSAQLAGTELLMASCEELVDCLRLRLGPAVKVYAAVRHLRQTCAT